jgi:hypothetical protein
MRLIFVFVRWKRVAMGRVQEEKGNNRKRKEKKTRWVNRENLWIVH